MTQKEPQYLYLTTTGRKSGAPREIEIWFTQHNGRYYIISCLFERAHWVQNIIRHADVSFRVGEQSYRGGARIVDPSQEPETVSLVKELSEEKYDWNDGLIVELVCSG